MRAQEQHAGPPAFDVMASVPQGMQLVEVQRRGERAGIPAETLKKLVDALRNVPQVQIGKGVSRERADRAKANFEKAGLTVTVTPVLALEAERAQETMACPACRERVRIGADRQCPLCGVFVDKFTQEYLAKRKQAELDRAAARKELEAEFEARLEAALKERMGVRGLFKGRAGAARAAALAGLLGCAFFGGRATLAGWNPESLFALSWRGVRADTMMATAWPAGAASGASASAMAASPAVDADDPIVLLATGRREGVKIANPGAPVPPALKIGLGLEFARQLAEMGQGGRATRVAQALAAQAGGKADLAAAASAAQFEIRAWNLGAVEPAGARAAAQQLLAEADRLADPLARVHASVRAAVALGQHPYLPREVSRAFVARAGEVLPAITAADQQEKAAAEWARALGALMATEATQAARAGRWSEVRAVAAQLDQVARQAPAAAQARLYALGYQLNAALGNPDAATASLDAALGIARGAPTLAARGALLRSIASGAGSLPDRVDAAATALQATARSGGGTPGERAQALAELAYMHAEAGFRNKAAEVAKQARQVTGLAAADAAALDAELAVRSDLIGARVMHGVGLYADSEQLVRKVGASLL